MDLTACHTLSMATTCLSDMSPRHVNAHTPGMTITGASAVMSNNSSIGSTAAAAAAVASTGATAGGAAAGCAGVCMIRGGSCMASISASWHTTHRAWEGFLLLS